MARKHKTDQSKLDLHSAAAMLKKLEEKTVRDVKNRLSDNWRDNLFEIMMTRIDLAAAEKKTYAAIPALLRQEPKAVPKFAALFFRTMRNMLKLAKAPALPHHVAAFSVLYVSVLDTFMKDETKDHSKTMATLDQRLGLFEQAATFTLCG